jgi:hypothetical protein
VVAGLVMGTLEKFYRQPSFCLSYTIVCPVPTLPYSTKDNKKRGHTHADVVHTRVRLS